jgi:tRNA-specific 2-thiouridylase
LSGGPWYVVKKNIHDNVIYVSNGYDTEKQYGKVLHLDEMHFITEDPWGEGCNNVEISFKNRHMPNFLPAHLTRIAPGEYVISSENKVQGIAPGQFAVIYDKDSKICYGSGIITGRNVEL